MNQKRDPHLLVRLLDVGRILPDRPLRRSGFKAGKITNDNRV